MNLIEKIENLDENQNLHHSLRQTFRIVFFLSLAAIILGSGIYLVGFFLPEKHESSSIRFVPLSKLEINSIVWDVGQYPHWQNHIEEVQILEKSADRLQYREIYKRGSLDFLMEKNKAGIKIKILQQSGDLALQREEQYKNRKLPFQGYWQISLFPENKQQTQLQINSISHFPNPLHRSLARISGDRRAIQFLKDLQQFKYAKN